jgi:hypothetical protein
MVMKLITAPLSVRLSLSLWKRAVAQAFKNSMSFGSAVILKQFGQGFSSTFPAFFPLERINKLSSGLNLW